MLRNFRTITIDKFYLLMKSYEDVIGLTEVKIAQQRVIQAEKAFSDTQELRRNNQAGVQDVQMKLKQIQLELDKTSRVEDRYLHLVTKEHSIIKEERRIQDDLKLYEKEEREKFSTLTNAVRESHEKERSYAEKTKYWSVIGSVTGAIVGILGTAYNNRKRMKELRDIVVQSTTTSFSFAQEMRSLFADIWSDTQQEQLVTALLRKMSPNDQVLLTNGSTTSDIRATQDKISKQLYEIQSFLQDHRLLSNVTNSISDIKTDEGVLYIGHDLDKLIKDTETRLQNKMQSNTVITIVAYGAVAAAIGIVFKLIN